MALPQVIIDKLNILKKAGYKPSVEFDLYNMEYVLKYKDVESRFNTDESFYHKIDKLIEELTNGTSK